MIIGKINVKSPQSGASVSDERGEAWIESIISRNLIVLNYGDAIFQKMTTL